MHGFPVVPILITIGIAIIIWWAAERFSPDPLLTNIVKMIVFIVVLVKLAMLLGFS